MNLNPYESPQSLPAGTIKRPEVLRQSWQIVGIYCSILTPISVGSCLIAIALAMGPAREFVNRVLPYYVITRSFSWSETALLLLAASLAVGLGFWHWRIWRLGKSGSIMSFGVAMLSVAPIVLFLPGIAYACTRLHLLPPNVCDVDWGDFLRLQLMSLPTAVWLIFLGESNRRFALPHDHSTQPPRLG
jgi:hypothetical protein